MLEAVVNEVSAKLEFELMLLSRHLIDLQRRATYQGTKLDRSAYVALSRIELDGPLSIKQLRERLGLDDSTLNRQTAAMVRAGLVERVEDPEGGAAKKFQLTDFGMSQLRNERIACAQELDESVGGWSLADREHLVAELRRLNESIEEVEDRPWPRDERLTAP